MEYQCLTLRYWLKAEYPPRHQQNVSSPYPAHLAPCAHALIISARLAPAPLPGHRHAACHQCADRQRKLGHHETSRVEWLHVKPPRPMVRQTCAQPSGQPAALRSATCRARRTRPFAGCVGSVLPITSTREYHRAILSDAPFAQRQNAVLHQ